MFEYVGRTLGEGAYGIVRLAKNRHTQKLVAIKILSKCKNGNLLGKKRMVEITILKGLSHPNIPKIIKIADTQRHLSFVMEYKGEISLSKLIDNGKKLSVSKIRTIAYQLLDTIVYIHSKNVIHRDIKPDNIVVFAANWRIALVDFGLAKVVDVEMITSICGTPHYMAPELHKGVPNTGFPSDIWAIGVLLYKMATGFLPFNGDDPFQLKTSILMKDPDLGECKDDYLRDFIALALQKDPASRPQANDLISHNFIQLKLTKP